MNENEFHAYLKNYLFTQKGAKFRINFKFNDTLVTIFVKISQVLIHIVALLMLNYFFAGDS